MSQRAAGATQQRSVHGRFTHPEPSEAGAALGGGRGVVNEAHDAVSALAPGARRLRWPGPAAPRTQSRRAGADGPFVDQSVSRRYQRLSAAAVLCAVMLWLSVQLIVLRLF